jgi:hypothetical protein
VPSHRRPKPSTRRAPSTGTATTGGGINRKRVALLGGAVVIIIAVVVIVVTGGSKTKAPTNGSSSSTSSLAGLGSDTCPLTGTPASGGVPQRPALAVKIGNEPLGARPQSGLNEADIVYDTPAEGGIMRYVAVFQCENASSIGPVRSVRYVDWHIIRQFLHPILAYANGIIPDVNTVASEKWLENADLLTNASAAGTRITTRVAPDNLYTSTSALYGLFPDSKSPPPPVFSYSSSTPSGAKSIGSVAIDFSYGTDVVWKWTGSAWSHFYGTTQDVDTLTGSPVTTTNIVIEIVKYKLGPYAESTGGSGDVESQTIGSGPGYILRGGTEIPVTWQRTNLSSPDTFTAADGAKVSLAPGRTWVEMVLDTTAAQKGAIAFS